MNNLSQNYFNTILSIPALDESSVQMALEIFDNYINAGVFKDCTFHDNVWHTTDEYSNVGIHFNFNQVSYKRFYEDVFGLEFQDFISYVKVFVTMTLGKNVLKTLQTAVNDLKRIIRTDINDIYGTTAELSITVPSLCIDFFSILPECQDIDAMEHLMDALESYISVNYRKNAKKQRSLAQFDSYFLFNDIMNDYWNSELDREERLFFYPLYLWWQITAIIPLRPREFILTERNCLEEREDGTYLKLRRDNLKGSGKQVSYKISDDYFNVTYKIPNKLAKEIKQYLEFTKNYADTEIKTLFVADPHYKKWGQKKHSNSRYLTYINMNTIMRYFFHDVIEEKYGLTVVYEREAGHLSEGEINYLHLGDTRHLALINIMAEGGTPVTAMLLAGHDDINISAHYYSNITNLIECRTYRQYRLVTKGNVSYQISHFNKLPIRSEQYANLTNGGKCYSENYLVGDISDCLGAVGKDGEIGYCLECKYYRNKGKGYFMSDSIYKRQIEDDCKALSETVRLVRLGKGNTEDIGEALLKLKSSSYSYREYYKEKTAYLTTKGEHPWDEEN